MTARPSILTRISAIPRKQALIGGGVVAVLVIGTVTAIALSGNSSKKSAAAPATTSSATPTPTPTKTAPPVKKPVAAPAVNPLTGIGAPPKGPILAVKIDDTENGRPSVGLGQADVVYIEQAEGGLTRMVAVFGTNKPTVEAVRSVRASDAELLSQYGRIHLVASGGGGDSLSTLDASIVKGVINDRGGPGFGRDGSRPAPYNLTSNLAAVSSAFPTGGSQYVGFNFLATYPLVSRSPYGLAVNTVVGSTAVSFVWDSHLRRYVRTIGGQRLNYSDGPAATANVLVQECNVTTNPADVDVMGNPSQFTHSVGRGRAVLFRNGHRIEGIWTRANATSPTKFVTANNQTMYFAPGGVYVVLAATGAPV